MEDKKIKIREEEKMTEPQMVEQALMHLMQSSAFLTEAGYKDTAAALMSFAYKAMEALSDATGDLKLVKDKLSNEEYDKVLNDILAIEV